MHETRAVTMGFTTLAGIALGACTSG
jgi:hypothetical protein